MIKPDEKVVRTIAAVAQQYPEFTTWVERGVSTSLSNYPTQLTTRHSHRGGVRF
jgi:hypothetical protein